MATVRAKKSLGQHFLNDVNIARKIVTSFQEISCASKLEIGPGTGMLTQFLIDDPKFFAIDIDSESIEYLKKKYPVERNWLYEGDFLKQDLSFLESPFAVLGNFPYYISSQIFFKLLASRNQVSGVVCMLQKEVAERIAAPEGSKTYGLLSVFLQTFFDIEYLFTVHEHSFQPAPRVKSAVIRLVRNQRQNLPCNEDLFFKVVKITFNYRRKTIRNSLKGLFANLDDHRFLKQRPEQLSVDEFIELTQWLEDFK
jgi:16S rRNA (adenine1518-N6/adenine1519-N6)-dimethyltransferase